MMKGRKLRLEKTTIRKYKRVNITYLCLSRSLKLAVHGAEISGLKKC